MKDLLKLSWQEVIEEAEHLIDRYLRVIGKTRENVATIGIDDVYSELIYPQYSINLHLDQDLGVAEDGKTILGLFDVFENTVSIHKCLALGGGDQRRAFTMCHEIAGHGVFQGEWLRRHYRHRFSKARLVTTEEVPSPKSLSILERQANLFAAHAAAPQWFVEREILRTFAPKMPFRFIKPGVQGFDLRGQYVERRIDSYSHLCRTLAKFIQHRFGGLSVESLGYRIQESGYVLDLSQRKLVLRRVA